MNLLSKEASAIANEQLGTPEHYRLFYFSHTVDHVVFYEEEEDDYDWDDEGLLVDTIHEVKCPKGFMFVGVADGDDMSTAKYGFVKFPKGV